MSPFCIRNVVQNATKFLKFGSLIKKICPKIILNRAFSIVKMPVREVTIFPERSQFLKDGVLTVVLFLGHHVRRAKASWVVSFQWGIRLIYFDRGRGLNS